MENEEFQVLKKYLKDSFDDSDKVIRTSILQVEAKEYIHLHTIFLFIT